MHKIFDLARVETLYDCLSLKEYKFQSFGELVNDSPNELIYINRNSPVLGIAHLDTVQLFTQFKLMDNRLFSETLDDRLGVWILLNVLPNLGIFCDVLLTTNEESCNSSAKFFKSHKDYNWIFQFDRHSIDCVLYQYETNKMIKNLSKHNFSTSIGSYSDICELGHLGVCGINFGVGYAQNHSKNAFCYLDDTYNQIIKFKGFYNQFKNVKFPYDSKSFKYATFYDTRIKVKPSYCRSSTYKAKNDFHSSWADNTCDVCYDTHINALPYYYGYGYLCSTCASELDLHESDQIFFLDDKEYIENPTIDQINHFISMDKE